MADEQKLIIKTIADTKGFTSGLNRMQSGLKKLGSVFSAVGGAYAASRIFTIGKDLVKVSAELETVNRSFERSFGALSNSIELELNKLSDSLGRSTTILKKGAVSFNSFFQGLGFGSQEAANMSVSMQRLSVDLASFFGIQDANAQKRFIAALAGSPEVLDQYGINLKQTALQQELYNMGLKTTVQNTSEVVKTQARLNVIMRAMTSAGILGDAIRATSTYAGKLKELDANFLKFKENMGGALKPFATVIVGGLNDLLKEVNDDIVAMAEMAKSVREALGIQSKEEIFNEKYGIQTKEALENSKKIIDFARDAKSAERVLNRLGQERHDTFKKLITDANTFLLLTKMTKEEADEYTLIANALQEIEKEISNQKNAQDAAFKEIVGSAAKRIELINEEFKFEKQLQKIDELKISDLFEQEKLQSAIAEEMAIQYKLAGITEKEYQKQLTTLARIRAAIAKKTDAGDTPTPMRKGGEGLLETEDINLNDLVPKTIGAADESLFEWEGIFDNTGFLEQLTLFQDGIEIFDHLRFDFVNGVKQMGLDLASGLSNGFASAISETLNGNKKFVNALRIATKQTLIAQSADLAAQAMYYGILGTALLIAGTFGANPKLAAEGVGYLKAAAVMGGGATVLGSVGKSIKGEAGLGVNGTGGNGNNGTGGRGGSFEDFMNAIQGEQTFRINGADLVAVVGRQNNFTNAIGG